MLTLTVSYPTPTFAPEGRSDKRSRPSHTCPDTCEKHTCHNADTACQIWYLAGAELRFGWPCLAKGSRNVFPEPEHNGETGGYST